MREYVCALVLLYVTLMTFDFTETFNTGFLLCLAHFIGIKVVFIELFIISV